jgi:hypothetical protein
MSRHRSHANMRGRRWILRAPAALFSGLVVLLVAAFVAGHLGASNGRGPATSASAATKRHAGTMEKAASPPVRTVATYPLDLPSNFTPLAVVGQESADGVWVIGNVPSGGAVYRSNGSTGALVDLDASDGTSLGQVPPIEFGAGTDAAGDLWVGFDSTLVEVSSASNALTIFAVPESVASAVSESNLPTQLQGYHPIDAIAISPAGNIAVSENYASQLEQLDPATGAFAVIPLPAGAATPGIADSLAFAPNGDLVAVVCQYESTTCTDETEEYGTSWLVAPAEERYASALVHANGYTLEVVGGRSVFEFGLHRTRSFTAPSDGPVSALRSGTVVTASPRGLIVYAIGEQPRLLPLGWTHVAGIAVPSSDGSSPLPPSSEAVPLTVSSLSADGAGDIWFVAAGSLRVGEVVSSRV